MTPIRGGNLTVTSINEGVCGASLSKIVILRIAEALCGLPTFGLFGEIEVVGWTYRWSTRRAENC